MKNKEQMQKIALAVLLAFGALYAYWSFLLVPEWIQIQQLREQIKIRQGDYQILVNLNTHQTELLEQMKNAEKLLQQGSLKVPAILDKPRLMMNLYNLAKQDAVNPESIGFEQVQKKDFYQQITMKFTCSGSSSSILDLIMDLQHGPDLLAIQSVNLTEQKGLIRAELILSAYATTAGVPDTEKPPFMNVPMGAPSIPGMFGI